jgi:hypothetical protein
MQHLDEGTLQAWLDGARSGLDPSRLAAIERHIDSCGACAARADALTRASFRAHAVLAVGRDQYAPRVPYEAVVRRARGSRTRRRALTRKVAATWAASIVGAAAVGWVSNEIYRVDGGGDAEAAQVAPVAVTAAQPTVLAQGSVPSAPRSAPFTEPPGATTVPANGSLADTDLVVRGVVEDEGGRPVPSAQVYVAELEVGVLTQPDGRYDLRLPTEPDSFELTVERIGFRQQTRAINGREGDRVAVDFRLREEALALDEIIVTGESDGGQRRSIGPSGTSSRAIPFVWRPSPSIAAEGYVGSDLWMMPGLDVLALEVAYGDNPNETHVARVMQDLGGGATLTLIEGRTDGRRTRWPIQSAGAVLSTWRGGMLITATAPVPADSLRMLLSHLR